MLEQSATTDAFTVPTFEPRAPWLGGDLQTLRNFLLRRFADLSPWPARRLTLPLYDGSGDALVGSLHLPTVERQGPLAVLIHGLTGCEGSSYVLATARHLLVKGFPVLRLNLRGAGPSRTLCRFQYHAGRSEDLRAALRVLSELEPVLLAGGLCLVGYSLGANMLLKFLAEDQGEVSILAAAAVSAPIDLRAAQRRLMVRRNTVYHAYLLARMKEEALEGPCSAEQRQSIAALRSVFAFDDEVVAPGNGFAGALDYYARCSAAAYLARIKLPTLIIHALDDPWIPADAYRSFDWSASRALSPLLPRSGGHVGFHGKSSQVPWHDLAVCQFFTALA